MVSESDKTTAAAALPANRRSGVFLVGGATASGKSAATIDIARAVDGVIVNADSMQVYRDLAVLTARPDAAALAAAPHRLYGEIDGAERCSVGRWLDLARAAVAEIEAEGKVPILVGGTGLYLKAFAEGMPSMPPVPQAVVDAATARLAEMGGPAFRNALLAEDPAAAAIGPSDTQRLVRAWAVYAHTGRPLSAWQADPAVPAGRVRAALAFLPDRETLYAACDRRFAWMVDNGAVDEVRALLNRGLRDDLPIMKAVGVPEIRAFLAGDLSREAMIAAGQQATRRYAKRQFTWFRRQTPDATFVNEQYSESLRQKIFAKIRISV